MLRAAFRVESALERGDICEVTGRMSTHRAVDRFFSGRSGMDDDVLLNERLRVRETIERYFFGVDAQDEDELVRCFTDEARAEYHRMTPEEKIVSGGLAIAKAVYGSCSQFTCSNHSVSNFVVDINSDGADANTFAIAHVIVGAKAFLRGLRYQDQLVRDLDGWRIARRTHTPLWQIEADVLPPAFARALSGRK
jgi:hypothetical protein